MFSNVYSLIFLVVILIAAGLAIYRRVSVHSIYIMGAIWGLMLLFFALSGAYWLALGQLIFGALPLLYVLLKIHKIPQTNESEEGV